MSHTMNFRILHLERPALKNLKCIYLTKKDEGFFETDRNFYAPSCDYFDYKIYALKKVLDQKMSNFEFSIMNPKSTNRRGLLFEVLEK
jgi:hypothetical protein